jgi:hypothetical protein
VTKAQRDSKIRYTMQDTKYRILDENQYLIAKTGEDL